MEWEGGRNVEVDTEDGTDVGVGTVTGAAGRDCDSADSEAVFVPTLSTSPTPSFLLERSEEHSKESSPPEREHASARGVRPRSSRHSNTTGTSTILSPSKKEKSDKPC